MLVVEDDQVTRAFLLENLIADGFRAVGASGAGEGLRAIEVRQPSLVVLDLGLDDGSGLALLDRVRAADGLASRIDPDMPVIVLSGRAGEADRVRGFARGADDYVTKPSCHFPPRGIPLVQRPCRLAGLLGASCLLLDRLSPRCLSHAHAAASGSPPFVRWQAVASLLIEAAVATPL